MSSLLCAKQQLVGFATQSTSMSTDCEPAHAGEQQRLGMARLFFQRPAFGALDECTNATSADVEEALYAHARELGITLVTVTQRTALVSTRLCPR